MCDYDDTHRRALERRIDSLLRENDLLLKRLEQIEREDADA